jgi:hypothetical protein
VQPVSRRHPVKKGDHEGQIYACRRAPGFILRILMSTYIIHAWDIADTKRQR